MTNEDKDKDKKEKEVTIIVDTKPRKIPPGTYTLAEFKTALGIDAARVVEQFIKGKFEPIDSGASIEVKAGEKFATHVPRGGSSWR